MLSNLPYGSGGGELELLPPRRLGFRLVGLIIAKEHRVSDFRQAWIDALRGEIAALIGRANAINEWLLAIEERKAKAAARGDEQASPTVAADEYELVHADVFKMEEALATIELRLNPKECKAKPLLEKAEAVVCKVQLDKAVCRRELKRVEKQLLAESKAYLKDEWETVKKGEPRHRWAVRTSFAIGVIGTVALVLGLAGLVMEKPEMATTATPAAGSVTGPEAVPEASASGTAVEVEPSLEPYLL